jgi:WD40 repeat protein
LPHDFGLSVAISPDERWLAITASADRLVHVWDLHASTWPGSATFELPHNHPANVLTFSASGRWLITGSGRETEPYPTGLGEARVWDMNAQDPTRGPLVLAGHEYFVEYLAMSSDERWIAVAGNRGLSVWDLKSDSRPLRHVPSGAPSTPLASLAMSPDSRWLVAGSLDRIARVWELGASGPSTPIELGHPNTPSVLHWIPEGNQLVVCNGDEVWLWEFTTEGPRDQPSLRLRTQVGASRIMSAALSLDGRWLATGSDDRIARIWDLHAEDPAATLIALRAHMSDPGQAVTNLAFAGRWLVTTSEQSTRLWDLSVETLLQRGRRLAAREFSADEIDKYLTRPDLEEPAASAVGPRF